MPYAATILEIEAYEAKRKSRRDAVDVGFPRSGAAGAASSAGGEYEPLAGV